MLMLRFFLILCLISLSLSYRLITRKQQNTMKLDSMHSIQSNEISNLILKSSTLVSLSLSVLTVANKAIAAETKPPSAAETKEAIIIIKQALDDTKKMASLASEKKYTEIAALFDTPTYKKFEDACSTLTRSDQLSQEDRKSLGTIKRYGVVADAIIMLGGIKGELKQGNVNVADSGGSLQKAIEDDEEDEDEDEDKTTIKVNYPEIQRFIKLSYDSIADIYRIVSQIKV